MPRESNLVTGVGFFAAKINLVLQTTVTSLSKKKLGVFREQPSVTILFHVLSLLPCAFPFCGCSIPFPLSSGIPTVISFSTF